MSFEHVFQALEPDGFQAQGEFESKSIVWRDRWLLFFLWVALLLTALSSWAAHGQAHTTVTSLREDRAWASPLVFLHAAIVFILLVSPLVVLASNRAPKPRKSFASRLRSYQNPTVYYITLVAIVAGQFSSLLISERLEATGNLALMCLLSMCVVWLTFRRPSIPVHSWVLFLTWLIALSITRLTLLNLLAIPEDPGWIVSFRAIFAFLILIQGALPLVLISPKCRRRLGEKISGLEIANVWIYLGPYILLIIVTIALIFSALDIGPLWAGSRLLAVLIAWLTGMLIFQLVPAPTRDTRIDAANISTRWFWVDLLFIGLGYVILAGYIGTQLPEIINPDGLVYLSIAKSYAEGIPVVRGYWSPLMSWLLSPAIFLGSDPFRSQRVLAGLVGLAWLLMGTLIAKRYGLGRPARLVLALVLGLLALKLTFVPITPDMLGGVLILLYFYLIMNDKFTRHPYRIGLAIGTIAGFASYAKHYNFPFFLIHLVVTGILLVAHKRNLRNSAIGIATSLSVFLAMAAPLIIANSSRYGLPTFSTSGAINYANMAQGGGRHPCWAQMLCDQPGDVLFPWEDPLPQYYPNYGWNPLDSLGELQHLFLQWRDSAVTWIDVLFEGVGPLIPLAFPLFGLAALIFWRDREHRLLYSWTFLTVLIYLSGYSALHTVELRFTFPVLPLLVVGVVGFLEQIGLRSSRLFTNIHHYQRRLFTLVFFLVPILTLPVFNWIFGQLTADPGSGCIRPGAAAISEFLVAPFAGSDDSTNYVAYYSGIRTFGVLKPNTPASQASSILQGMNVRTYYLSAESDLASALSGEYQYQKIAEVRICSIDYIVLSVPTE